MLYEKLVRILTVVLSLLLFLLPLQTIWITQERYLNGVKWEYGTLGFYATEGLLWIVAASFLVWYWKLRETKFSNFQIFKFSRDRVFLLSLLSLIAYHLSSIIWALDKQLALQQSLRVMEAAILFLMLLLGPLTLDKAAKWFVAGAIIQALLGIYQFLTQSTFSSTLLGLTEHPAWQAGASIIVSDGGRWLRAYGAFPHPNVLGGYLVVAVAMLFWCHKAYTTDRPNTTTISNFQSLDKLKTSFLISNLSLVTLTAGIYFTFSRSAWLALVLTLILIFFSAPKKYISPIAVSLTVLVILSAIFFPFVQTRFSNTTANELASTNERVAGYSEAAKLWRKHPWLGLGAGNYTTATYKANPNRPGWKYQPVHNVPLLFLSELGIIGVSLFFLFLFSFLRWTTSIGIRTKNLLSFLVPLMPLLLLDHYLYSLFTGLGLMAIYLNLIINQEQKLKSQI